jgi:hypothetical protein
MNHALAPTSNGNGHQAIELPAVAPAPVHQPQLRDWKYLDAFRQILAEDGRPTLEKLATKLGITHQAVSKQRRRPGFEAWVSEQIRAGRADRFDLLYERNWNLAMRGSIDHSNWCAKVEGRFKQADDVAGGGPVVNVLIRV